MARIRTIKPEFADAESMGRMSRDARLLFAIMWTIADDEGRMRGAPRLLASRAFPYDDDAPALIDGWLEELEREGCIVRYEVSGERYIAVAKWSDHQKVDHPATSRIPEPPESASQNLASPSEVLASPREVPRPRARALDLGPRTMDLVPSTVETPLTPHGGNGASPPANGSGLRWQPVTDWCAEHFGDAATLTRSGKPRAFVGNLCHAVGPPAMDDPAVAVALLDEFRGDCIRDQWWKYVTTGNIVERVGKWLADRKAPKAAY